MNGAARTQKARGVQWLEVHVPAQTPRMVLIQDEGSEGFRWACPGGLNFARPCPMTPRHGFVDSRVVQSPDDARAVFQAALAADPGAELMLMAPIDAAGSAILTPGAAVVGPGNDGATAGRGSVAFGLSGLCVGPGVYGDAGITDTPYLEVVYARGRSGVRPYFVQLRDGPAGSAAAAYVPRRMRVAEVIKINADADTPEDLLVWERKMKAYAGRDGVIVDHTGGSMVSHYAVHARLNEVAIFTRDCPAVGAWIDPVGAESVHDAAAFRAGVGAGMSQAILTSEDHATESADNLGMALLVAHHAFALTNAPGSWLLGYGSALLVRYCFVASHGEARYAFRKRSVPNRDKVYTKAAADPVKAIRKAGRLERLFSNPKAWTSESVGGANWADCTRGAIAVDQALREAFRSGTGDSIRALVGTMHTAINRFHNNGWYLNKFVPKALFDAHAAAQAEAVSRAVYAGWDAWVRWENAGVNAKAIAAWLRTRGPRAVKAPEGGRIYFRIVLVGGRRCLKVQTSETRAGSYASHTIAMDDIAEESPHFAGLEDRTTVDGTGATVNSMAGTDALYAAPISLPACLVKALKAHGVNVPGVYNVR